MVVPEENQSRRFVPFIVASLLLTLTFGATLGMINLARLTGTWGSLSRPSVWAHGYVQMFGFVALFVMGFAYHAVPRFVGAALQYPVVVPVTLWLPIAGLLCVVAALMLPIAPVIGHTLWIVGAGAILGSAVLFAAIVIATMRKRYGARQSFERWMIAGALWLVFAAGTTVLTAVLNDTTWHHVLWPGALYGFAGSWIFGAGRRLFPISLGWLAQSRRLELPAFVLYQLGVAAWSIGAWPDGGQLRLLRFVGALVVLVAVPAVAHTIGLFRSLRGWRLRGAGEARIYELYVYAGWFWLAVGLATGPGATLVAVVHGAQDSITMLDFSRHTIGVGFVTQMIMAIGARFVPVFSGSRLWSPRAHRFAFVLLNTGVAIRGLEAALVAGYWPAAWAFIALSGPPVVLGLLLFAANMFVVLGGARPVYRRSSPAYSSLLQITRISGGLDVLAEGGFPWLRCSVLATTIGRLLTLQTACWIGRRPLDPLVVRLSSLQTASDLKRPLATVHIPEAWEPIRFHGRSRIG